MERKGEKIGWIGGWIGAFFWIVILGIVWFFQGDVASGIGGIVIFLIALVAIFQFSPWKHTKTKYWKLLTPIYILFLLSVLLAVYAFEGFDDPAKIQYGLWVLPCLTPLFILGNRTWE